MLTAQNIHSIYSPSSFRVSHKKLIYRRNLQAQFSVEPVFFSQSFVVNVVCPLMKASDIRLEELDVSDAQSQLLAVAEEDVSTYVFRYQMGVASIHPVLLLLCFC